MKLKKLRIDPIAWPAIVLLVLVAIAMLAARSHGADPIRPSPAARVPNRKDVGVCWWAAAETAGHHLGIPALDGLTAKVVSTGIGWQTGAREEDVAYWMQTLGVAAETNPHGATALGKAWVEARLAKGIPVVMSGLFDASGRGLGMHAILALGSDDREGGTMTYYDSSQYPDPGTNGTMHWAWAHILPRWTGRAYAFDPGLQGKPGTPQPVAVAPGPVLVPLVVEIPAAKPQPPAVKDSVQRPDDEFRYGPFRRPYP